MMSIMVFQPKLTRMVCSWNGTNSHEWSHIRYQYLTRRARKVRPWCLESGGPERGWDFRCLSTFGSTCRNTGNSPPNQTGSQADLRRTLRWLCQPGFRASRPSPAKVQCIWYESIFCQSPGSEPEPVQCTLRRRSQTSRSESPPCNEAKALHSLKSKQCTMQMWNYHWPISDWCLINFNSHQRRSAPPTSKCGWRSDWFHRTWDINGLVEPTDSPSCEASALWCPFQPSSCGQQRSRDVKGCIRCKWKQKEKEDRHTNR